MIKAFFFDVDGILVEAIPAHRRANAFAYKYFGYDFNEVYAKSNGQNTLGMTIKEILKIYSKNAGISENQIPTEKLYKVRQKALIQEIKKDAFMMPGALNALKQCKAAGKLVAIVTSGSKKYLSTLMEMFKFGHYVDFEICEDDVSHGKPDPECYLQAYSKLNGIPKDEVLVIEDAKLGVEAAKRAGLKVLFVPYRKNQEDAVGFDYMIKSLEDFDINKIN